MIPMIYLASLGLVGVAAAVKKYRERKSTFHGVLTNERQAVYESAMNHLEEPDKLHTLAGQFDSQGLPEHAMMLRKRAQLRAQPPNLKKARREVFKKALASKNKEAIKKLAQVYLSEGCTGAAAELNKYADGLPD